MFEYDKYYRECQQLNKSFIKARINPKHGNYYVLIDLMTCNYEFSKYEQEKIKKLVQNEIEFLNLNHKSIVLEFNIDKELAWFDGISSINVDKFCENLYDLTECYHN